MSACERKYVRVRVCVFVYLCVCVRVDSACVYTCRCTCACVNKYTSVRAYSFTLLKCSFWIIALSSSLVPCKKIPVHYIPTDYAIFVRIPTEVKHGC
jgi:hypothetical protein